MLLTCFLQQQRKSLTFLLSQETPISTSTKNYFQTRVLPLCEKPCTTAVYQHTKIPTHNRWQAQWLTLTFFYCRLAFIYQLKNAREQLVRKEDLPRSCDSLPRCIYRVQAPSHNFFPSIWYKYLVLLMSLFQITYLGYLNIPVFLASDVF